MERRDQAELLATERERWRALESLFRELKRAEERFPGWPDDPIIGAAIIAEEAGELVKAALDGWGGGTDLAALELEAAQTAAMGLRFLIWLARRRAAPVAPPGYVAAGEHYPAPDEALRRALEGRELGQ